jgi:hypothetical protein
MNILWYHAGVLQLLLGHEDLQLGICEAAASTEQENKFEFIQCFELPADMINCRYLVTVSVDAVLLGMRTECM